MVFSYLELCALDSLGPRPPQSLVPRTLPTLEARGCSTRTPLRPLTHAQGPGVSGAEQPCLLPAGERGVAFPWRRDWRLKRSKGVTGCQHLRTTLCFYVLPIFEIQLLLVNRHVTMSRISSVFIFISVWALLFLMSPAVG